MQCSRNWNMHYITRTKTKIQGNSIFYCLIYMYFSLIELRSPQRSHRKTYYSYLRVYVQYLYSSTDTLFLPQPFWPHKRSFRIFKIYIAPTTSIGSIFIFQGTKNKNWILKVLKKRSGRGKFDGSVAYIKQIYLYFWPQDTSFKFIIVGKALSKPLWDCESKLKLSL
jgi:hypothetical protein